MLALAPVNTNWHHSVLAKRHKINWVAAALVGMTCAAIGVYMVLRCMAFTGDALAHLRGVVNIGGRND